MEMLGNNEHSTPREPVIGSLHPKYIFLKSHLTFRTTRKALCLFSIIPTLNTN